MSKKLVKRMTIVSGGVVLFKVVYRQITELETMLKVHTDKDPSVHLGLVQKELGFEPHITYEETPSQSRAHKTCGFLTNEEFLNNYLVLFSEPGALPPRITSVTDKEEMKKMHLWLKAAAPRVLHPPMHRKVMVFKEGPLKEVIMQLLNRGNPYDFTFDVEEFIRREDERLTESEKFDWKFEDEVKPEGLEVGFLEHPSRFVIISSDAKVVEFNRNSFDRWCHCLEKLPGMKEFFDELKVRGMRSIGPMRRSEPR